MVFSRIWSAVLLGTVGAEAAFELDGPESSLPFSARHGLYANPADLNAASCFQWSLGQHLPFGLRQLRRHSLGLTRSFGVWGGGAGVSSTGYDLHRELSAWVGAGGKLTRRFSAGASLTVLRLQQDGAEGLQDMRLGLGFSLDLVQGLQLSAWWQQRAGTLARRQLFAKVEHRPGASNPLYARMQKRGRRPTRLALAAEHRLHRRLRLIAATRSSPRRFAMGLELGARRRWLQYAVVTHAQLGPSHTFTTGNSCRGP